MKPRKTYWQLSHDVLIEKWHAKRRATDPLWPQAVRPLLLGDLVRDLQRMDRILERKRR